MVFRPRSILSLILTGFILALLPLAVALGVALVYVDRLADQSRMVVVQAVEATQGGRLLINQLTDMERNVRQYLVLGNNDLLSFYRDTHGNFQDTLTALQQLALEPDQMATLEHLQQQELALFKVLRFRGTDTDTAQSQVEEFVQIVDLGERFSVAKRRMGGQRDRRAANSGPEGYLAIGVADGCRDTGGCIAGRRVCYPHRGAFATYGAGHPLFRRSGFHHTYLGRRTP